MSYNVKLDVFEGPLDLLLFFIKRDEINIYDIPIAYITQEYLDYLRMMKELNLHLAGEFILMASLLIRLKVQMLLPRSEDENLEEIEDPRTELVEMLVEYQKYKNACNLLRDLEEKQSKHHWVNCSVAEAGFDPDLFLSDVDLMDLALAFKKIIAGMPKPAYYEVKVLKINIGQQTQILRSMFQGRKRLRFSEVMKHMKNRIEVVVTFLAILELIKIQEIQVSQSAIFDDFWISIRSTASEHVNANA